MKKDIYLSNYCHADHVWTNTRPWHMSRYLRSVNLALNVIKENPEFVYVIDNYCHFLQPFFENFPERVEELKKAVENGNIVFLNGGFSLPRPTRRAEEEFVRNVVKGKKVFEDIGGKKVKTFYNADTAAGHTQLPQILKLSEHENYIFWRPELALDYKKIPKRFHWKGLDGTKISACRVIYSSYFNDNYLGENYEYEKAKEGFEKEIESRAYLLDGNKVLMFEGIDDCLPCMGALDTPAPTFDFIKEYNAKNENKVAYASPDKYFDDSNSGIPEFNGVIEQCDVAFNLPTKMPEHSLYRKRIEIIYALLKLESLSAICQKFANIATEKAFFDRLWDCVFLISGHAEDNAIDDELVYLLNRVNQGIYEIEEETLRLKSEFTKKVKGCDNDYIIFNFDGRKRYKNVKVHITSANGVHDFIIKDAKGNQIDYQITRLYKNDKPYKSFYYSAADVLVRLELPAMGYERLSVEFSDKNLELKVPLTMVYGSACGEKVEETVCVDNGLYQIKFGSKGIESITDHNGRNFSGAFGTVNFERTESPESWWSNMPTVQTFTQENFECRILSKGELCNKFEILGRVGDHGVRQIVTIEKGNPLIGFHTEIDCVNDCGRFWAKFGCDKDTDLRVGVPFGEEERMLELESYDYEDAEQNIRGLFHYGDYIKAKNGKEKFGITNVNLCTGAKHMDDGIYLFLRRMFGKSYRNDDPEIAWYNQCDKFNKATGIMDFEYGLCPFVDDINLAVIAKEDLIKSESVKKYENKGDLDALGSAFEIKTQNVAVSSFRKVDNGYELRVFETNGIDGKLEIESEFKDACVVNLNGKRIDDNVNKIAPYQIKTIRYKDIK